MKTLLIFTLHLISDTGESKDVESISVTACGGGRVTIKCKYEDEYKTKLKSFCLHYGNPINKTCYLGGSVNISCKYPESHKNEPKFFCKRVNTAVCSDKTFVNKTEIHITKGNISLYDDREKQILTVTIRYVTVQDSGTYWCGATSNWKSNHGYRIYSIQIYLRVTVE
ncbi:CMRF35-like molecule 6 [Electrophorus electricus]|uniref:CMRF35-like molecule 6 n=1 Tax=Electrophorus electricus TaxID=8005 RepID=UPI0015CFB7DE|nr:CMRF35-like molecule 6 [Electrophorus electricus]